MEQIFQKMVNTLAMKQGWHRDKMVLYNGYHKARTVKITNDSRLDNLVKGSLDWPKIAVDYLTSDCVFDAFDGDEFGVTRVLVDSGGDRAISSAITNATIGAVSYVAIIPRDNEFPILVPFSGSEATGLKTARGDELSYGLAVKKRDLGVVTEYYLFEKGAIHVVDASGKHLDTVELGVDAMPFIQFTYDEDLSSRPYGRSRLSSASTDNLDAALRGIGLGELISLINTIMGDILIVQGDPEEFVQGDYEAGANQVKLFFSQNQATLESFKKIDSAQIESTISRAALQYASSMSMDPTIFGEQPTNGSYSAETLEQMSKPYRHELQKTRMSYGASIKLLAIELFKIVAQTNDVSGIMGIQTVFKEDFKIDKIGAIGDAMQKMSSSIESTGNTLEIPQSMLREILGIPLRPQVIDQELPNFEVSRRRFREVRIDGV